MTPTPTPTQDELKAQVAQAALAYLVPGQVIGVGTGSTVNKFIEALARVKDQVPAAVSSSGESMPASDQMHQDIPTDTRPASVLAGLWGITDRQLYQQWLELRDAWLAVPKGKSSISSILPNG